MFYNIQNNNAPDYLCSCIPPTVQSTTVYPLRNGEDIIVPFCRLTITNDSFIPSTIRKWNSLDPSTRKTESISKFKNEIKRLDTHIQHVPSYYAYGPRKLNMILTQIRCCGSFLNSDLFRVKIVSSPSCNRCGARLENAYHYFFECRAYAISREILFQNHREAQILLVCVCSASSRWCNRFWPPLLPRFSTHGWLWRQQRRSCL